MWKLTKSLEKEPSHRSMKSAALGITKKDQ